LLTLNQTTEALDVETQLGTNVFDDEASSTHYMVASLSQWITYENNASFADKINFLTSRCLLGFAIWTLDYNISDFQALTSLIGEDAMINAIVEDALYPEKHAQLVNNQPSYTGQNCYVMRGCTDGTNNDAFSNCRPGYSSIATGHVPLQIDQQRSLASCPGGQWHQVCCPTDHMQKSCKWQGAPIRSEISCASGCDYSHYELTRDGFVAATGGSCYQGARSVSDHLVSSFPMGTHSKSLLCWADHELLFSFAVMPPRSSRSVAGPTAIPKFGTGLTPVGTARPALPNDMTMTMEVGLMSFLPIILVSLTDPKSKDICPLFNRAVQGGTYLHGYTVRSLCCPTAREFFRLLSTPSMP